MVRFFANIVMKTHAKSLVFHIFLLGLYCVLLICIWRLPVLLAGDVYDVFPLLDARNFAATGMFSVTDVLGRFLSTHLLGQLGVTSGADGRLSAVLIGLFSSIIDWHDLVGWTLVSSATIAVSAFLWWLTVYRLFEARTAWVSVIIFSCMPIYWREALWLDAYNFALLFFFASTATFVWLREKSLIGASIASGIFFGLSIASKDALLIFLPWILVGSVWTYRKNLNEVAVSLLLFFVCAGGVYVLPYMGDIARDGYPSNQNLTRFWPGDQPIQNDFYLHLYPDPYTFFFDKDHYDADTLAALPHASFLERVQKYKILINFEVGSIGLLTTVANGLWLFAGVIPNLFQQEHLGGAALWLFIVPGLILLWRKNTKLCVFLIGLFLSSEFVVRFVMHYARNHLMDTGWIFALFAALGVVAIADALSEKKIFSPKTASVFVTLFLAMQLVQANRVLLANQYRHAMTADVRIASAALASLPEDSVIASGYSSSINQQLAFLSDRTIAPFASETVERLVRNKSLSEAFQTYRVTHVIAYDAELTDKIELQTPSVEKVVLTDEPTDFSVSTFQRFLLHLFR